MPNCADLYSLYKSKKKKYKSGFNGLILFNYNCNKQNTQKRFIVRLKFQKRIT